LCGVGSACALKTSDEAQNVTDHSLRAVRTAGGLLVMATMLAAHVHGAGSQPSELQQRTGDYVAGFVRAIANVVAQESYQSRDDKKITSDVLLVRYPGSVTDLILFRDVVSVNGTPIPSRQQHLLDLFQQDFASAVGRANQIAADSSEYVPPVLNPLYAVAFLQPDYQPRFKMDERNTDPQQQWPRHTKILSFTETQKPTLLRSGMMRENDVPTRGSAWIEEATGRILQTELQIRHPDGVTTIKTIFTMDPRLQIMVPSTMQTTKPEARATYTNFRRFMIQVDEAVHAGFEQ
jgi:hypothetical protein